MDLLPYKCNNLFYIFRYILYNLLSKKGLIIFKFPPLFTINQAEPKRIEWNAIILELITNFHGKFHFSFSSTISAFVCLFLFSSPRKNRWSYFQAKPFSAVKLREKC